MSIINYGSFYILLITHNFFFTSLVFLAGCDAQTTTPVQNISDDLINATQMPTREGIAPTPEPAATEANGETDMFEITSAAFKNMEGIPEIYTCKGKEVSPPLSWSKSPEGTQSLALIMDDPDAPIGTWDHWVLFNISPHIQLLEENMQATPEIIVGRNSWNRNNYGGPCPPGGARHRYFFKLYALDSMVDLKENVKKSDVEKAMENHILATAELIGIYKP